MSSSQVLLSSLISGLVVGLKSGYGGVIRDVRRSVSIYRCMRMVLNEVARSNENKCIRLKAVGQHGAFDSRSGALTSPSNNKEINDAGLRSFVLVRSTPYCSVKQHKQGETRYKIGGEQYSRKC